MALSFDNLTFDYDQMSAQDMWDFQRESGGRNLQQFAEMFEKGEINEGNFFDHLREVVAFVWIIVRQNNPGVTFEEVAEHPLIPMLTSIQPENVKSAKPAARKKTPARVA